MLCCLISHIFNMGFKLMDGISSLILSIVTTVNRLNRLQHITLVLASLHWLLVLFIIDFKIYLITSLPGGS